MNEKDINVFDDEVIEKIFAPEWKRGKEKWGNVQRKRKVLFQQRVFAIILKPLSISFIWQLNDWSRRKKLYKNSL